MIRSDCTRAEILAGAVALGEASDVERDEYRLHLSGCRRCVVTLGGEREIERVMETVALARDAESWEPDLRAALAQRGRTQRHAWRFGLSVLATAVVASVGIHALVATGVRSLGPTPANPVVVEYNGQHITLERRPAAVAMAPKSAAHAAAPARGLVVVHNVVTLTRPATVAARPAAPAARVPAAPVAPPRKPVIDPTQVAELTPSQHDERSIGALRTGQAPSAPEGRAESLAVMPAAAAIREVAPLGGEYAIVPHPAAIAYDEGAEGTTAFEVSVDERGTPTKCTITKASGFLVLDEAVCRAAMRARYAPKTINGRAVAGTYHDAFVFRANDATP